LSHTSSANPNGSGSDKTIPITLAGAAKQSEKNDIQLQGFFDRTNLVWTTKHTNISRTLTSSLSLYLFCKGPRSRRIRVPEEIFHAGKISSGKKRKAMTKLLGYKNPSKKDRLVCIMITNLKELEIDGRIINE
jgi:hypothetical protein